MIDTPRHPLPQPTFWPSSLAKSCVGNEVALLGTFHYTPSSGVDEGAKLVRTNLLQAEILCAVTDIYKESLGEIPPKSYRGICPNRHILLTRMGAKGGPHATRFSIFSKTKMNVTND